MDKSATTIIASCTVASGETTALASCTRIDCSRATQLILSVNLTFAAASTEGALILLYTSSDNSTWDDYYWDSFEIPNCRELAYTSGDYEFMIDEVLTAEDGGVASVSGWTLGSGTWAGGDAAGNVYLHDIVVSGGGFVDTETLTGSDSGCVATQSGSMAAHAVTRTYYSTTPTPLYIKARIHNLDTSVDITLASLISVKQTI